MGLRKIADIQPGDHVLTHKGRFRRVLRKGSRISDHVYRLKGKSLDEIHVTGEHPALVMDVAAPPRLKPGGRSGRVETSGRYQGARHLHVQARGCGDPPTEARETYGAHFAPAGRRRAVAGYGALCRLQDHGSFHQHCVPHPRQSKTSESGNPPQCRHGMDLFGLFAAEGSVSREHITLACDEQSLDRAGDIIAETFGVHCYRSEGAGCHRSDRGEFCLVAPLRGIWPSRREQDCAGMGVRRERGIPPRLRRGPRSRGWAYVPWPHVHNIHVASRFFGRRGCSWPAWGLVRRLVYRRQQERGGCSATTQSAWTHGK